MRGHGGAATLVALVAQSVVVALSTPLPPRPVLKPLALPLKLAGGLFLFKTSVPQECQQLAQELRRLAQLALRADPRVTMELGMGIEAGGVFSSAASKDGESLVINFQLNGGNIWAEATAFGVSCGDSIELLGLTVANMDAAMMGETSLTVALPKSDLQAPEVIAADDNPPTPPTRSGRPQMVWSAVLPQADDGVPAPGGFRRAVLALAVATRIPLRPTHAAIPSISEYDAVQYKRAASPGANKVDDDYSRITPTKGVGIVQGELKRASLLLDQGRMEEVRILLRQPVFTQFLGFRVGVRGNAQNLKPSAALLAAGVDAALLYDVLLSLKRLDDFCLSNRVIVFNVEDLEQVNALMASSGKDGSQDGKLDLDEGRSCLADAAMQLDEVLAALLPVQ
mmetsp:Transcript_25333/g.54771  ORF Transcript_25333/g.54771 Transcript_25333/m.54771 type:complete len:396 (-) Transcript_25333:67-1254(-)|eukprot:CAMPEP_0183359764 /NCGR_PEP_ID=MMETSP0164_2-20130417/53183_1 /TAXON_ID=221442 /ORGANISM="Coccolithus pelagicus ssp braarudi, Strain PLY182g" /LENGTH=395 /DNA_ID=CAMNT_0025533951 /DNA_START=33 /DNA_END=1220 /DNA_ORIENTATION=+